MQNRSPIQPKLLSRINERLVIKALREQGPQTRAEMSRSIGVTFPTVAKAVASLLESDLLEEFDDEAVGRGRPAKRLRLASSCSQVIGVTLSDSQCELAAAGLDGVILPETVRKFATPHRYKTLLDRLAKHARELVDRSSVSILGLGMSIPGIVDYYEQRAIISANLPLLDGKQIGKDLQKILDIDCLIIRDAHAFSLSERIRLGPDASNSNIAMLDHSEGIGLGLVVDGEFITGDRGFAGELGHTTVDLDGEPCHCGRNGCLETLASEWSVEARLSRELGRTVAMDEIIEMAQSGDARARDALYAMCRHLAVGVASVVNLFNPGKFYIYGRSFRAMPELLDALVDYTEQYALQPSFAACEFAAASGGELEGTIASVINYLTDSLVPDVNGYVSLGSAGYYRMSEE